MTKRINCVPPPEPRPVPKANVILELTMEQAEHIKAVLGRCHYKLLPIAQVYDALAEGGVHAGGLKVITSLDGEPCKTLDVVPR